MELWLDYSISFTLFVNPVTFVSSVFILPVYSSISFSVGRGSGIYGRVSNVFPAMYGFIDMNTPEAVDGRVMDSDISPHD